MSESHYQLVNQLPAIRERNPEGNKGSFGKILLIAGSQGMSGAAILSGNGALRGGAGLVYLAVPVSIQNVVATAEPSYLTIALPEDENGRIDLPDNKAFGSIIETASVIAIGPGLGQSESLKRLVKRIYESSAAPVIFDADAINLLAQLDELPEKVNGPRILTPHPGEFSRLTGLSIDEIQAHRQESANDYARKNHLTLLLKGSATVISDTEQLAVNPTGNPGMATGGSGDVLTGLITALIGQGYSPFEACQLGAYLHGRAGDLAAEELSGQGMIASDIPRFLPNAWLKLIKEQSSQS